MTTHTLSGPQAGQLATHARKLLQRGQLTAHQFTLLDAMLWRARRPGSAMLAASMAVLARLAGQGRSTVAEGLRALEKLGLVARIRRRVRVAWGGSTASRQIANAYLLKAADTESSGRPAREQASIDTIIESPNALVCAAQEALAARRSAIEARLRRGKPAGCRDAA